MSFDPPGLLYVIDYDFFFFLEMVRERESWNRLHAQRGTLTQA